MSNQFYNYAVSFLKKHYSDTTTNHILQNSHNFGKEIRFITNNLESVTKILVREQKLKRILNIEIPYEKFEPSVKITEIIERMENETKQTHIVQRNFGAFCCLNDYYKDYLVENVNIFTINSIYPQLIYLLKNNKIFNMFFKNRLKVKEEHPEIYTIWKVWINYYFGLYLNDDERDEIVSITHSIMKNFFNKYKEDIIYVDCDTIFHKNKLNVFEIFNNETNYIFDVHYEYEDVSVLCIDKKKYMIIKDNQIVKNKLRVK